MAWKCPKDLIFHVETTNSVVLSPSRGNRSDPYLICIWFLTAGVMIGGLVEPAEKGIPQGGPLSPLLSNIVLDELDRELEQRGSESHYVRLPALRPLRG